MQNTSPSGSGTPRGSRPFLRPGLSRSPAVKVFLIGFVTLLLLIPSSFVWVLVEERAGRADEVAFDIARSWGGTQSLNGPYLVVPFVETVIKGRGDKQKVERHRHTMVLFPEDLNISGDVPVDIRQKSIYRLPVYRNVMALSGRFAATKRSLFEPRQGGTVEILADKAFLAIGIADVRALKTEVDLKLEGSRPRSFEPGLRGMGFKPYSPDGYRVPGRTSGGIHAPLTEAEWSTGFAFSVDLALNGSKGLFVSPAGQTTRLELQSDWPHPGFAGAYLPDEREISQSGFSARWSIPYLARGVQKAVVTGELPLARQVMGVNFVNPVDFYQTVSRSLKYAIGFFALTFLAVFMLEMHSGKAVHVIQYLLTGFALIVFYVMLLALSEHIGYGPAYGISALAATSLIGIYMASSLGSWRAGAMVAATLGSIYTVLYVVMGEQDYALLAGAIISFLALAVTMFATRRIDWSHGQEAV